MRTKIQRWGNSLGLRIPKLLANEARLDLGTKVDLEVRGGRLVIRPVVEEGFNLEELLADVKPENLHGEVETGGPVGREA